MKKTILCFLLLALLSCVNAQVDAEKILSKTFETFTLDNTTEEYVSDDDDGAYAVDVYIMPSETSFSIKMEGMDETIRWQYLEDVSDENSDYYETEEGELLVFDYENQLIWWYYDYNATTDFYESLNLMSDLEVFE